MIKSKKQISFSMCVVFIAIIIYLPSVMGYVGVKYPNLVYTSEGTLVYGDLDSFKGYEDDDEIKWVGSESWGLWCLYVSVFFDGAGNPGDGNKIILNYRNSGLTIITVKVLYFGGGGDTYLAFPTGEDWELEYIDIDNDKSVYAMEFFRNHWLKPKLEIDYLGVHYGLL